MIAIPLKLRKEMSEDPYYYRCAREDGTCKGRITWEHALLYANKRVQEKFAIIPICEYHHGLGKYWNKEGFNKEINELIALSRATEEDFNKYPKAKERWKQQLKYLKNKYNKND